MAVKAKSLPAAEPGVGHRVCPQSLSSSPSPAGPRRQYRDKSTGIWGVSLLPRGSRNPEGPENALSSSGRRGKETAGSESASVHTSEANLPCGKHLSSLVSLGGGDAAVRDDPPEIISQRHSPAFPFARQAQSDLGDTFWFAWAISSLHFRSVNTHLWES